MSFSWTRFWHSMNNFRYILNKWKSKIHFNIIFVSIKFQFLSLEFIHWKWTAWWDWRERKNTLEKWFLCLFGLNFIDFEPWTFVTLIWFICLTVNDDIQFVEVRMLVVWCSQFSISFDKRFIGQSFYWNTIRTSNINRCDIIIRIICVWMMCISGSIRMKRFG